MRKNTLLLLSLAIVVIGLFIITMLTSKKTVLGTTQPTLEEQFSGVTNQYQKGQITPVSLN